MIDYIIVGVVCVVLFFAIRKITKNKKKGGCSGCSGCANKEMCGSKNHG